MGSEEREIGCFIRIENNMSHFSDSERKVAKYVLDQPRKVVLSSGNEIAEATGTSISCVTRFCKRIGYSGLQEFKIVLTENIAEPLSSIHENIKLSDDVEMIKNKVTQANIHALESTLHVLDNRQLHQAIDLLHSAERIAFFGMGGSGSVALDAQHKFLRTGKRCIASIDKHMQLIYASMFTSRDVMVGITHSGNNNDMLDVFKIARIKSTTIAITQSATSPISKLADITLHTSAKETDIRPESLASRIAALTIVDMLYVGLGLRMHTDMLINIKRIREAISVTRTNVEANRKSTEKRG
jgi:DNA-binding MurR/RpiR family transcriptional regulator